MFDWQDLKHFVVLARTGSLSAAAREMGCDHATVGRRVAAMEKALGLRLILRLPRSTPLTQDGKMIAGLAAEIEHQSHAIARHARSAGETPQTQVRISAPPSVAARIIAPEIARFHQAFPHITLILSGESAIAELDRGDGSGGAHGAPAATGSAGSAHRHDALRAVRHAAARSPAGSRTGLYRLRSPLPTPAPPAVVAAAVAGPPGGF